MSSSTPAAPPKPKRRWLTFSLRSFLAFTLLAGLVAAYFSNLYRHVSKRRATLARLSELGFSHEYDFDSEVEWRKERRPLDRLRHPPGPWIGRAVIGDDAYATVMVVRNGYRQEYRQPNSIENLKLLADLPEARTVSLSGSWVTDDVVEHLAKVRGLQGVELHSTKVSPQGFARLAKLSGLKTLDLEGDNLNDETFEHLHELPHLERLNVQEFALTPAGLAHLGKIASLESLSIFNVQGIDANSLQHLASLEKLDELVLYGLSLDEAAAAQIGRIKSLKSVMFQKCGMNDEAARRLGALSELESLSLGEMPLLGDGCVEAFLPLRRLEQVFFNDSQLTDDGFLQLAAMPSLQVISIDSTPGPGGTLTPTLVTAAAGKKFADLRPECNVYAGGFSHRPREYVLRRERKKAK
jgi:hypothetical protein